MPMRPRLSAPRFAVLLSVGMAIAALSTLAACSRGKPFAPPPHATDTITPPREVSTIAVPIDADAALLSRALERAIPRALWDIDRHVDRCVPAQRVKLFGERVKVTPDLGCDIVGTVTRGGLKLHGQGQDIVVDLPIKATVSARDIGGIIKSETATGSAMAHALVRLSLAPDWTPRATVRLSYDWKQPPGIDILGQRVTFTDKADEKLRPVVQNLERTLPGELRKVDVRGTIAGAWRDAFTSLELNRENPPVWMRVTPQKLRYGGYALVGNRLRLNLGMEAITETFVGPRPADPRPTPLPNMVPEQSQGRFHFFIPVTADYAELEPVIMKALIKRQARPFDLPRLGPVVARFGKVVAYGTTGGRVAVGLDVAARPQSGSFGETRGRVWLVATPFNDPGTQKVHFRDLAVSGETNRMGGDLLLQLANSPSISETIADSLAQNFTGDFDKLLGKIRRAIDANKQGDFVIHAEINQVENGVLRASGSGLYLPVRATGNARISYRP